MNYNDSSIKYVRFFALILVLLFYACFYKIKLSIFYILKYYLMSKDCFFRAFVSMIYYTY